MVLSLYLMGKAVMNPLGRTQVYSLPCLSLRALGSAPFFPCQGHAAARPGKSVHEKKWQRMCTNVNHDWLTA